MSAQRIVFMGTPAFAVASLDALLNAGIDVAAVVTAPDRPAGRGQATRMSAVKEFATALPSLKDHILQPEKLKDPAFHQQLDALGASLYVVVAFRMLPEVVWNRPALGTINLHASLLPAYRGAAPINWTIINGEERTGVTTFRIRHEIDSGDLLHQEATIIGADETAGELHDRLKNIGAVLLVRSVIELFHGKVEGVAQEAPSGGYLHAPKLTPENCRIDQHQAAECVHNFVRGLSPAPGAWTMLTQAEGLSQHFKILRTRIISTRNMDAPGSVSIVDGRMLVHCGSGTVEALEVQAEGKRRMDAAAFVRGLRSIDHLRIH